MTSSTEHGPGGHSTAAPLSPDAWDARYAGAERVWSGDPNGALVALAGDLPPGTALDVGCGEGADAVWLAARGWQVTACDVSDVALDRARAAGAAAGVDVTWRRAALEDLPLPADGFDLVSVHYPALLRTPGRTAERALTAAVAPGGLLLVVHHAGVDEAAAREHGFRLADYVAHEDVVAALGPGWTVEVDEVRPRTGGGGGGAHHREDLVLLARRGR
ncbi:class I SAM-dependent methyltransferase [Cellulomonas endophytica]|uniref:class I SAM-dependent methyltransferase n=1 Tax=Cellulomonas endophytica TaxID=2494735 RepID=UPI0010113CD6|nr:class I SAM-dependent methyltransferase [Cellulomonas endophytica]